MNLDVGGEFTRLQPGLADSVMLQALGRQAEALSALGARLERLWLDHGPGMRDTGWRGTAQLAYDSAIRGLRSDLDLAQHSVSTALWQTHRAIDALNQREPCVCVP